MKKIWTLIMVLCFALASQNVMAKRMGGGFSFGKQSNRVTQQRQATPPAAPQRAANGAAGTTGGSRFGGMLGGLAAGLGLAWLAQSLGFGEGFGNVLMVLLLVVGGVFLFRMLARPRYQASPQAAGAANGNAYRQNDAQHGGETAARPWSGAASQPAGGGSMIGSGLLGGQTWGVPEGFDTAGFLTACKRNFINLQGAWDRSDIPSLRAMMTDEMLVNIQEQLSERDTLSNGEPNVTEVLELDAQMLGIEEVEGYYMASVEFNGLIREQAGASPTTFREVWNVTRPISGPGGWVVAGVQALG